MSRQFHFLKSAFLLNELFDIVGFLEYTNAAIVNSK